MSSWCYSFTLAIQVGDTYGRKMLKGYIQGSKGVNVSERKLRALMPVVSRDGHSSRQTSAYERRNPSIYIAHFFGHKLHLDQNEKLVHYGVTFVMARDGFSGMIVASAVMPKKNNLIIYDQVYRRAVLDHGLWQQIRVDHGREFYLSLFIQECIRQNHGDSEIAPYVQTTSTHNHIIERLWVELNKHVVYPIKRAVVVLDDMGVINMNCPITVFSVSMVLMRVSEVGMNRMIQSWNSHSVPNKGVPNVLRLQNSRTVSVLPTHVPQVSEAADMYTTQGGHLTDPEFVGHDPLCGNASLVEQREAQWTASGLSPDDTFTSLVPGDLSPLENSITSFIEITNSLSSHA